MTAPPSSFVTPTSMKRVIERYFVKDDNDNDHSVDGNMWPSLSTDYEEQRQQQHHQHRQQQEEEEDRHHHQQHQHRGGHQRRQQRQQRRNDDTDENNRTRRSTPPASAATMIPPGNEVVTSPHPTDVLCGRGGKINSHPGNVRFRSLVDDNRAIYLDVNTKKADKARIASSIVANVRAYGANSSSGGGGLGEGGGGGGRFLKEDPISGMWIEIGDEKAVKKTGQALRECAPDFRAQQQQLQQRSSSSMMRDKDFDAGDHDLFGVCDYGGGDDDMKGGGVDGAFDDFDAGDRNLFGVGDYDGGGVVGGGASSSQQKGELLILLLPRVC